MAIVEIGLAAKSFIVAADNWLSVYGIELIDYVRPKSEQRHQD